MRVTVQVTDSAGNTYQETFTIGVTNNTADDVCAVRMDDR